MTMITGNQIPAFRLMVLRGGLELEIKGLRVSKGRSCATIIREMIGSKTRDKTALLREFEQWMERDWIPV